LLKGGQAALQILPALLAAGRRAGKLSTGIGMAA
jgi:hypothetical protein